MLPTKNPFIEDGIDLCKRPFINITSLNIELTSKNENAFLNQRPEHSKIDLRECLEPVIAVDEAQDEAAAPHVDEAEVFVIRLVGALLRRPQQQIRVRMQVFPPAELVSDPVFVVLCHFSAVGI